MVELSCFQFYKLLNTEKSLIIAIWEIVYFFKLEIFGIFQIKKLTNSQNFTACKIKKIQNYFNLENYRN